LTAALFGGLAGLISVLVFAAIYGRLLAQDRAEDIEDLEKALLASRKNQVALLDELCKQAELLSVLSRHNADIATLVAIIARLDKQEEGLGKWN